MWKIWTRQKNVTASWEVWKDYVRVDADRWSRSCQVAFFSVNTSQWKPYTWYQSCLQGDSRHLRKFFKTLIFLTIWNLGLDSCSRASPCQHIYWMLNKWIPEELTEKMLINKRWCLAMQNNVIEAGKWPWYAGTHSLLLWHSSCRSWSLLLKYHPQDPALLIRTPTSPLHLSRICCWNSSCRHLHHLFHWKGSSFAKTYH